MSDLYKTKHDQDGDESGSDDSDEDEDAKVTFKALR
jgi:hypothetical protein